MNNIRIGGDFEILPNLIVGQPLKNKNDWVQGENLVWTDTGRSAILLALQQLLQKGVDRVAYLPLYCCESVKQPFIQLDFDIKYYSMGKDLQHPCYLPNDLENKVFLFINYFGFENKPVYSWLKQMSQRNNFYIIEDCVQAAFNNFNHKLSHYKIYSFRKFTAMPDGAVLISRYPFNNLKLDLSSGNEKFLSMQVVGKILRGSIKDDDLFLNMLKKSEELLYKEIIPKEMADISKIIMERIDVDVLKYKRRTNWSILHNLIKKNSFLKSNIISLYTQLSDSTVPLGYPIIVNNNLRDKLLNFFITKNIFCPVHWRMNNSLIKEDYELSNKILTIPIDQRIGKKELEYIGDNLITFFMEEYK